MSEAPILQWHVTWSTVGRLPIAPEESRRRAMVRAIVAAAGPSLVLFCVVDDHVHVWLIGPRPALMSAIWRLRYALTGLAAAPLQAHHVEVVGRRSHGEWLVGYLLTQTEHHGLPTHPGRWTGAAVTRA